MSYDNSREAMAKRIQAILAQAEGEAKAGNEAARDNLLEKAAALQLKYAIEDAMLAAGVEGRDELVSEDFCTESNTPLIKAKRSLIAGLAQYNRGRSVMMGEWKNSRGGGRRYDKRAKVRVYAHESDLRFITMLYNSLIIQMQTMMAADEKAEGELYGGPVRNWAAWRVSYAHGWVGRVLDRICQAKQRNEAAAETGQPGTALVLRDREAVVQAHIDGLFGTLKTTRYRTNDTDAAGRAAGRQAADKADLGHERVGKADRPHLQA